MTKEAKREPRCDAATDAINAAHRFNAAAVAWLRLPDIEKLGASKEGGEMRRRSMDLTRALARLRNPWRERR